MTIQDSQKDLLDAGLMGVITSSGKDVTSSPLGENEVLYGNDGISFVLFNGSKTMRKFRFDVSAILSPGAKVSVNLYNPNSNTPFTFLSKKCNGQDTIGIKRTVHITVLPGASLEFKIENSKKNIQDGFVVQIKNVHEKKVCQDCKEMFGVPDKYVKAFIVLILISILAVFIFEFFTLEKDEH